MTTRIYLDNAATSWPKPEAVYRAVDDYQRQCGAPAGRGAYADAVDAERLLSDCRLQLSRLLGADRAEQIALAFNGTDALNLALHGVLRRGDRVVTTDAEHNSVLRPLAWLAERLELEVVRIACDDQGLVNVGEVLQAVRERTRLVAITHASNVTGAIQPVEALGAELSRGDTLFLVDAAQTIGHLPVTAAELGADLIAASGHKGLMGPLGTGLLYVGPRAEEAVLPLRQGGTGTRSEQERQPDELPSRLESGNHNLPGIAGLRAALIDLESIGLAAARDHEQKLVRRLLRGLERLPAVTVHGPPADQPRTGVVSLTAAGYDPQELAATLDAAFGVQARAGLHCAPAIHRRLGTVEQGGTLRLSIGRLNTTDDIDAALEALGAVTA